MVHIQFDGEKKRLEKVVLTGISKYLKKKDREKVKQFIVTYF